MDPVSIEVLSALAGSVGGELARQSWARLIQITDRWSGSDDVAAPIRELADSPDDDERARALAQALAEWAAADRGFADELQDWQQAIPTTCQHVTSRHSTKNKIIGGNFYGPVVQAHTARDVR